MPNPIKELPFPWPCGKCGEEAVERETLPYSTVIPYDGRSYSVEVPEFRVPRCKNCGAMVFDDSANDQITDALRRQVGLLPPERIRANRESLGLTQRDFANLLGVGESTVSRWETGSQIQQKCLDRLMRLFFAFPAVRDALFSQDRLANLGMQVGEGPVPRPTAPSGPEPAALFQGGAESATPLAELASQLDALTEAKRRSALVEFQRLAELMMN
jgi:putative zinc finger/helix-turn-helix YgiT family protein